MTAAGLWVLSLILLVPLLHWAARLDTITGYPGGSVPRVHHHGGLLVWMGLLACIPSLVAALVAHGWGRIGPLVVVVLCVGAGAFCEAWVIGSSNFSF